VFVAVETSIGSEVCPGFAFYLQRCKGCGKDAITPCRRDLFNKLNSIYGSVNQDWLNKHC